MDHLTDFPKEVSYKRFDDDTKSLAEPDIPLRRENRKTTDKYFLFVFIAAILIVIPFIVYTLMHSDINRLESMMLNRSRHSGRTDRFADDEDLRERLDNPYHRSASSSSRTERDPDMSSYLEDDDGDQYNFGHRSVRSIPEEDIGSYLHVLAWRLTFASFISLGICLIVAAMFRYATAVTVWGILILSWLAFVVYILVLILKGNASTVSIVILCIINIVLLCILIFMKNRIRLVIMLFKEATKATFQMQMIFSIPALTVIIILLIAAGYATTTVFMSTAEDKTHSASGGLNNVMIASVVLNFFITVWIVEFVAGVQYMSVSGAIVKWYFSRNKDNLGSPVYTSLYITVRYHLGTVAFGSLIITLVTMVRMLLRGMANNHRLKLCVECCMRYLDGFLRFFTKNSYIVTAMHGTSFIQSGRRAVHLLTLNICNTISLSSIGDFVITMSYVFVVCVSIGITSLILPHNTHYEGFLVFVYLFVCGISLLTCFTILGTFKNAFSTLFLCVCQDFVINNGTDKPYAMTRDLMEFLDDSKKMFAEKIAKKNLPTI